MTWLDHCRIWDSAPSSQQSTRRWSWLARIPVLSSRGKWIGWTRKIRKYNKCRNKHKKNLSNSVPSIPKYLKRHTTKINHNFFNKQKEIRTSIKTKIIIKGHKRATRTERSILKSKRWNRWRGRTAYPMPFAYWLRNEVNGDCKPWKGFLMIISYRTAFRPHASRPVSLWKRSAQTRTWAANPTITMKSPISRA